MALTSMVTTCRLLQVPFEGSIFSGSTYIFNRTLKKHMLFKKKKKKRIKYRDGYEYTVDHAFWERHFEMNPEILMEREKINQKRSFVKKDVKAMSFEGIYQTLTSVDKKLATAGIVAVVAGAVALKITFM